MAEARRGGARFGVGLVTLALTRNPNPNANKARRRKAASASAHANAHPNPKEPNGKASGKAVVRPKAGSSRGGAKSGGKLADRGGAKSPREFLAFCTAQVRDRGLGYGYG